MYCAKCGELNENTYKFCAKCGSSLKPAESQPVGSTQGVENQFVEQKTSQHVAQQPVPQSIWQQTVQYAPEEYNQPQTTNNYQQQPAYYAVETLEQTGCARQAWAEFRKTEHWFKTLLLLGLILIVPVLNLAIS